MTIRSDGAAFRPKTILVHIGGRIRPRRRASFGAVCSSVSDEHEQGHALSVVRDALPLE